MKTDAQIQSDIMEELKWNPSVTHTHIGVSVDNGVVTLSGTVPTYIEKSAAETAALRVEGVKAVTEKIEVKLSQEFKKSDEDIAQAALSAFKWNVQIPDSQLKVTVENGHVSLSGEVEWEFQKSAAEAAVRDLTGVTWVTNSIAIKSKVNPVNVKEKIEQALKRAAEREAKRINVEVRGNKVVLSGKVHSFSEIRGARGAAWSAPGVTEVVSNLQVAA
ncbi:MAG: BON domain-containing protein [Bdellovibrionota bacterium]